MKRPNKESTTRIARRIAQKRHDVAVRNLQRAKEQMTEARVVYERAVATEERTRLEFEHLCS